MERCISITILKEREHPFHERTKSVTIFTIICCQISYKMHFSTLLTASVAILLSTPVSASKDDNEQYPIILNSFQPSKFVPAPAAAKTASASSSYTCDFAPKPTGCELGSMMPFPFNCSMFYICTTFGPLMQTCPNSTVFDLSKTKCVAKNETTCVGCCKESDCA